MLRVLVGATVTLTSLLIVTGAAMVWLPPEDGDCG